MFQMVSNTYIYCFIIQIIFQFPETLFSDPSAFAVLGSIIQVIDKYYLTIVVWNSKSRRVGKKGFWKLEYYLNNETVYISIWNKVFHTLT
jgi:hypothetical protein